MVHGNIAQQRRVDPIERHNLTIIHLRQEAMPGQQARDSMFVKCWLQRRWQLRFVNKSLAAFAHNPLHAGERPLMNDLALHDACAKHLC